MPIQNKWSKNVLCLDHQHFGIDDEMNNKKHVLNFIMNVVSVC